MTKRELIDRICGVNGKISDRFLANFPREELEEYLCLLQKKDVEHKRNTQAASKRSFTGAGIKRSNSR